MPIDIEKWEQRPKRPKPPPKPTPFVPPKLTRKPSPRPPLGAGRLAPPPPGQPVVKLTGAQPKPPVVPTAPIQPTFLPGDLMGRIRAGQGLPLRPTEFLPEPLGPPSPTAITGLLPLANIATSLMDINQQPFVFPIKLLATNLFNISDIGDQDWWSTMKEWGGQGYEGMATWFKGGLIGLNFIQKIPERLLLTPMIAGSNEPPIRWWTNLILQDLNEPLYNKLSTHPVTQALGRWTVGPKSGWHFDDTFGVKRATAERFGLSPEGEYAPVWNAERAYDFERLVTDPDTGKIKWDILMGKYNHEGSFLDQLFETTGLSGIAVTLALHPERFDRFTEMVDDGEPLAKVIMEVEDPWAEFAFNTITDPFVWLSLGVAGPKLATFTNRLTYFIWPPSFPIERASAWALTNFFRGGYAARGAILRRIYDQQDSAKRWILNVSKVSQHATYSDAVDDTFNLLALRYDSAVDPDEPIEYFQRILLGDTSLIEGKLGPQRTAQLQDALALLDETLELDINTILEHYGPFADLLGSKKIAEVALEGALKDPEIIAKYIAMSVSDQYSRQLGIHYPSKGSLARYLNWMGRLAKEQWLAINPGYLANNFIDNTAKTIISNNTPTFDLHAAAKIATYLGDTFDEVLPANVAQSMVEDAFDVGRHLATADLPWPLGEPEGWAKTIRLITGQKIPDKIYDWMIGSSKAVTWMRRTSYSGLLRRGFDATMAIEQSARAGMFLNAFDDYITNQGLDSIIEYISRNPDVPQEYVELVMNRVIRKPADFDAALTKIIGSLAEPVPDTWISGMAPAGTPDFEFIQALRQELDSIQKAAVGAYDDPKFMGQVGRAFARARKAAKDLYAQSMNEILLATETQLEALARATGDPEIIKAANEMLEMAGIPPISPPAPDYDELMAAGRVTIQDMARAAADDSAFAFAFDPELMTGQLDMAAAGRYPNNPVIGVLFEDLPNADSVRQLAKDLADTPGEEIYRQAIDLYNQKYRFPKGLPPIGEAFPMAPPPVTPEVAPRVLDPELARMADEIQEVAIVYDPVTGRIDYGMEHVDAFGNMFDDAVPEEAWDRARKFRYNRDGNTLFFWDTDLAPSELSKVVDDLGIPLETQLRPGTDPGREAGTVGEFLGRVDELVTPEVAPKVLSYNKRQVVELYSDPRYISIVVDPNSKAMAVGDTHALARSKLFDDLGVLLKDVEGYQLTYQGGVIYGDEANIRSSAQALMDAGISPETDIGDFSENIIGKLKDFADVPVVSITPAITELDTAGREVFTADQLSSINGLLKAEGRVRLAVNDKTGLAAVDVDPETALTKIFDALGYTEDMADDFWDMIASDNPIAEWTIVNMERAVADDMLSPELMDNILRAYPEGDLPIYIMHDPTGHGFSMNRIMPLAEAGVDPNGILIYSANDGTGERLAGRLGALYEGFQGVTADATPSMAMVYNYNDELWEIARQEQVLDHLIAEPNVRFYYDPSTGHIVVGEPGAPHTTLQIKKYGFDVADADTGAYVAIVKDQDKWFVDIPSLIDLGPENADKLQAFMRVVGKDGDEVWDYAGKLIGTVNTMTDITEDFRLKALRDALDDPMMRFSKTDLGPAIVYDPVSGLVASADVHYNAAAMLNVDQASVSQFRIHDNTLYIFSSIFEEADDSIWGIGVTKEAWQALMDAGIPGDMQVRTGNWGTNKGLGALEDLAKNFVPERTLQPLYTGRISVDELWNKDMGWSGWWDNTVDDLKFVNWLDERNNDQLARVYQDLINEDEAGDEILAVYKMMGDDTIHINLARTKEGSDQVMADFVQYLKDLGIADDQMINVNENYYEFQALYDEFSQYMVSTKAALVEQFRIRDLTNATRAQVNQLKMRLGGSSMPADERGVGAVLLGVHTGDGNIVWTTSAKFHGPLLEYTGVGIGEVGQFTLTEGKGIMTSAIDVNMAEKFALSLADLGAPDRMPFQVFITDSANVPSAWDTNKWTGTLGEFLGKDTPATEMFLETTAELTENQAKLGSRAALFTRETQNYAAINESLTEWDRVAAGRMSQGIDTKYVSGPEAENATKAVGALKDEWAGMLENASYHGIGETNRVLFDYQARNNWEEILRTYAPFTTWQLRNPLFWAQAFAKQPALIATAIAYYRMSEIQRKQRNMTGRFEGTVGFDTPEGGYLAADVSKAISIFGQHQQPFEAPDTMEEAPGLTGAMQWIVQQARSFGINPWPWWSYPMEKAGIVPEGTTQFSFGPQQRAIELALRQVGVLEPGEGLFGLSPTGEFLNNYWTNRRLAEMEAEGLIDHGQFLEALENPEDANWKTAQVYVADLQQKFGAVGLFNPFTLKYASPGEVLIRESLKEKRELPPEVKQWYNTTHPYLEAYNALFEGEVDRAVSAVFYKYEELIADLKPWDDEYKQLTAERSMELEALTGPQAPTADLKVDYLADPINIGESDDIGGTYDYASARTSTLHRMRDMEPRAGEFASAGGTIDWEAYNDALDDFMNNIEILSDRVGLTVDVEDYIRFRYQWASPERVAYDLYKDWRTEGWEVYGNLKPEADGFLDVVNWAAEQQYMKDLSAGFTPIEAARLKAENLAEWAVGGLPYDYRQELLGPYGEPINLTHFSSEVADILGMDLRGEARFVIATQLSDTLPNIFGEDDPVQSMTNDMYDYYYNLMPNEKRQVRDFLGVEEFDLGELEDKEVMTLYRKLGLQLDANKLVREGALMYDEPLGLAILPTWDELSPEEERDLEQLRVDWHRYTKAKEAGVYGTWTDLMEKYYSSEDSGAGRFWGMLNGISLSSAAFDDPVVGPLLSKATRAILEPTDEQYERAADYLEERLPALIDAEKTQLIMDHPNWYEQAQQERGEYDRFRVLELEIMKSQYYAIYYKERDKWKQANPEDWELLRDYMARNKARALAYPYYAYFFKSYDYRNYYGHRTPDEVPEDLAPQLSADYLAAIDEMEAYLTGQSEEWTDGMSQFFGKPPAAGPEDNLWVPKPHEAGRDQYLQGQRAALKYIEGEQIYTIKGDPQLTAHAKKFLSGTTKFILTQPLEREGLTRTGFMREERDIRAHTSYTVAVADQRNINLGRHEAAHAIDAQFDVSGDMGFRRLFFPMDTHSDVVIDLIDDPYQRVDRAFDALYAGEYMPVSWPSELFAFLFAELAANPEDVPPEIRRFYDSYIIFP